MNGKSMGYNFIVAPSSRFAEIGGYTMKSNIIKGVEVSEEEVVKVAVKQFAVEPPDQTAIEIFIHGIKLKLDKDIKNESPLDNHEKDELIKCDKLIKQALLMKDCSKMIRALVAYKINKEKLWRGGNYKNCVDFLTKNYNYEKSSVYDYISSGRAIRALLAKYRLEVLPSSIAALSTFASIKNWNHLRACC